MVHKVIPQVEFDKSVQRILAIGLGRQAAESIVLSFWRICENLNLDYKKFLDASIVNGELDVDQRVLDQINKNLPLSIRYRKDSIVTASNLIRREL